MKVITKLKFKRDFFKSLTNPFFMGFVYKLFWNVFFSFFVFIKMSKYLSAKYYQENKERLQT